MRNQKGFTLIELMIVVVIIGILASIAIPNFIHMQVVAKEGNTRNNMHTFQLSAEDWAVRKNGLYGQATTVANFLPANFKNPFDGTTGKGHAWDDDMSNPTPGCVIYIANMDSTLGYVIYGNDGTGAKFTLTLNNGS